MSKLVQGSSDGEKRTAKVMIISTPRSVSTALLKCMSCIDGSLAFLEPYLLNTWFGKDREFQGPYDGLINPEEFTDVAEKLQATNIDYGYDVTESSYAWCKKELEKEYPDKRMVICKEISYGIRDHKADLPNGYRYVFLIRNPLLVFPSWKKMHQRILQLPLQDLRINAWTEAMIPQYKGSIYKEMCDLFEFVKKNRDPSPIVIDAEDLLSNPAKVMQACFKEIAMPYNNSILQWDASDAITRQWVVATSCLQVNEVAGLYRNAFNSSQFLSPKKLPDTNDLTNDEVQFAQDGMPYYEQLYGLRIK